MFRWLTGGESHGPGLTVIVDGLPAGVPLEAERVARELARRQEGYGRGGRMRIERDRARFLGGVRRGRSTGAPVVLWIENRDWANWQAVMDPEPRETGGEPPGGAPASGAGEASALTAAERRALPVERPRPGHADLAGSLKYGHRDMRDVLERASARETAARTAAGAVARALLAELGVEVGSFVERIGPAAWRREPAYPAEEEPWRAWAAAAARSPVHCPDAAAEAAMMEAVDQALRAGDTVGGRFVAFALGVPPGLGSYAQWDRRLDGRLAQAIASIPGVKAVAFGAGEEMAELPGSRAHDPILPDPGGPRPGRFVRPSDRAGGLEGGVTNGEPLVVSAVMKPLATLRRGLPSVHLPSGQPAEAAYERSDVCVVPAAGVVAEAMLALVLAEALLEKLGGDSLEELRHRVEERRRAWEAGWPWA
ncbi:MAG: chorismate synthase [Bacillota bacterium]|nr:chorismate synthase [Bacillota bacterium]